MPLFIWSVKKSLFYSVSGTISFGWLADVGNLPSFSSDNKQPNKPNRPNEAKPHNLHSKQPKVPKPPRQCEHCWESENSQMNGQTGRISSNLNHLNQTKTLAAPITPMEFSFVLWKEKYVRYIKLKIMFELNVADAGFLKVAQNRLLLFARLCQQWQSRCWYFCQISSSSRQSAVRRPQVDSQKIVPYLEKWRKQSRALMSQK